MRLNRFVFFALSLFFSTTSSILLSVSYEQIISDPAYVQSLNLSANADSFGIALAAAFIVSTILITIHLILHIIFFILCFSRLKNVKIGIFDFFLKANETVLNVIRIAGYLLILYTISSYIVSFSKFYIWEVLFDLSIMLTIMSYVLWTTTIIRSNR